MASQKMGKSKKRRQNVNLKARRAASWKRGQARKEVRIREQHARERKNKELRAAGLPTPWEQRVGVAAAERMRTYRKRLREARVVVAR